MPRIFDNIEQSLLPALRQTLEVADRADFCVGYFNLRGWKQSDRLVDRWPGGPGRCCRLLVGMQRLPGDELRSAMHIGGGEDGIDNQTALRLKRRLAEEFRSQLTMLYLLHRTDPVNPIVGYLGSSNLTFSGLSSQGELNVDVLDHDAATKLARWFDDRWCVDISDELAQIIEESWAHETRPRPSARPCLAPTGPTRRTPTTPRWPR